MAEVISLEEERVRRGRSVLVDPAFAQAWESIFEALELIEDIPLPKTQRAYKLIYAGLRIMLDREERRLGRG